MFVQGELQLSVKLITHFNVLLVVYMVQLGFILDRLVFGYVVTSIEVILIRLT